MSVVSLIALLALATGSAIGGFLLPINAGEALSCTNRRTDTEVGDYAEITLSRHTATILVHRSNPALDLHCDLQSMIDTTGIEQTVSNCEETTSEGVSAAASELSKPSPENLMIAVTTHDQALQAIQLTWLPGTREVAVSLSDGLDNGPDPIQLLPCQD